MKLLVIFIITIFSLFLSPNSLLAQGDPLENPVRPCMDSGDGRCVNPGDRKKSSDEIFEDFLNIFFRPPKKNDSSSGQNPNNSTPSNSPTISNPSGNQPTGTLLTPVPSIIPINEPSNNGNLTVYRQCNYRDVLTVSGCNMCGMGCGITSAAMIIATLVDPTIDPVDMMNMYKSRGAYMSCAGTDIMTPKSIMEEYGLQTSNYIFNYSSKNAVEISEVADDIRGYVKNGWLVFVLANFKYDAGGHFYVITDIDENNRVTSFDPYYEPPESSAQPINYSNRKPYPLYRTAFAVKKP